MHDSDLKFTRASRREVLALMGGAGAMALFAGWPVHLAGAADSSGKPAGCVVTPQQTEGPYFLDLRLKRSDIRADARDGSARPGVPLTLRLSVASAGATACQPLAGAVVDIWHCDATGAYSLDGDADLGGKARNFLRGYQVSDAQGRVEFTTIYPGAYRGRAVHIHFKVRAKTPAGQGREFTSQLYFDDALSDRIYARAPYAQHAQRRTRNREDFIFRDGGERLLLPVVEAGDGFAGSFEIGLRMA